MGVKALDPRGPAPGAPERPVPAPLGPSPNSRDVSRNSPSPVTPRQNRLRSCPLRSPANSPDRPWWPDSDLPPRRTPTPGTPTHGRSRAPPPPPPPPGDTILLRIPPRRRGDEAPRDGGTPPRPRGPAHPDTPGPPKAPTTGPFRDDPLREPRPHPGSRASSPAPAWSTSDQLPAPTSALRADAARWRDKVVVSASRKGDLPEHRFSRPSAPAHQRPARRWR